MRRLMSTLVAILATLALMMTTMPTTTQVLEPSIAHAEGKTSFKKVKVKKNPDSKYKNAGLASVFIDSCAKEYEDWTAGRISDPAKYINFWDKAINDKSKYDGDLDGGQCSEFIHWNLQNIGLEPGKTMPSLDDIPCGAGSAMITFMNEHPDLGQVHTLNQDNPAVKNDIMGDYTPRPGDICIQGGSTGCHFEMVAKVYQDHWEGFSGATRTSGCFASNHAIDQGTGYTNHSGFYTFISYNWDKILEWDDESDRYDFYGAASNAATYFDAIQNPSSEVAKKNKEDDEGAGEGQKSSEQLLNENPLANAARAGSLLGFIDLDIQDETYDGFRSSMGETRMSQSIPYDSLKSLFDSNGNTKYLGDYIRYGQALNAIGADETNSTSTVVTRRIGGLVLQIAYLITSTAHGLFGAAMDLLVQLNPFRLIMPTTDAENYVYDAAWMKLIEMLNGGKGNAALRAVHDVCATIYEWMYTIGWLVVVMSFMLLIGAWFLKKNSQSVFDRQSLNAAIRLVFFVAGIPLIGLFYTGTIAEMQRQYQDSLSIESTGAWTSPEQVMASTFVNFEAWAKQANLAMPSDIAIHFNDKEGVATDFYIDVSPRKLTRAINKFGYRKITGRVGADSDDIDLDTKLNKAENKTNVKKSLKSKYDDLPTFVMSLLDEYRKGTTVSPSFVEQTMKKNWALSGKDGTDFRENSTANNPTTPRTTTSSDNNGVNDVTEDQNRQLVHKRGQKAYVAAAKSAAGLVANEANTRTATGDGNGEGTTFMQRVNELMGYDAPTEKVTKPKVGDTVTLSNGKQGVVTKVNGNEYTALVENEDGKAEEKAYTVGNGQVDKIERPDWSDAPSGAQNSWNYITNNGATSAPTDNTSFYAAKEAEEEQEEDPSFFDMMLEANDLESYAAALECPIFDCPMTAQGNDVYHKTTGEGIKVSDNTITGNGKANEGMSGLALFNYLNSEFGPTGVTVNSAELTANEHQKNAHYSVTTTGSGVIEVLYMIDTVIGLSALTIVTYGFTLGMLFAIISRSIRTIMDLSLAQGGSLHYMARATANVFMMIIEIIVTIMLYTVATALFGVAHSILEQPILQTLATFLKFPGATAIANPIAQPLASIMVSIAACALFAFLASRAIKTGTKALTGR